jgi:hypothetical protein
MRLSLTIKSRQYLTLVTGQDAEVAFLFAMKKDCL